MKPTKSKSRSVTSSAKEVKVSPKPSGAKPKSKASQAKAAPAKVEIVAQKADTNPSATDKQKVLLKPTRSPEDTAKKSKSIAVASTPATIGSAPKKMGSSDKTSARVGVAPKIVKPFTSKSRAAVATKIKPTKAKPAKALASGAAEPTVPASPILSLAVSPREPGVSAPKRHPTSEGPRAQPKAPEPALPSILFEEDPPASVPVAKPLTNSGAEMAPRSGPVDPSPVPVEPSRLSGKLLLAAQNPNTLFVYCDLAGSSLEQARVAASGNRLYLRIHRHEIPVASFQESEFPQGTHGIFIQVSGTGSTYTGELGCYADERHQNWVSLMTSEAASTPELKADHLVAEDARFGDVLYLVQSAIKKQIPLVEVVQHLHLTGQLRPDELTKLSEVPWPTEYASILRDLSHSAQQWGRPSSLEFLRPLSAPQQADETGSGSRRRKQYPTSPKPSGAAGSGQSSDHTGKKGFWFNVNVEIVVYGSTQPEAKVMLAGRHVKLLPDGSFSMRYALPDGACGMDANATAADGSEMRHVHLHFSRATARDGEVGQHPQDPDLRPPG